MMSELYRDGAADFTKIRVGLICEDVDDSSADSCCFELENDRLICCREREVFFHEGRYESDRQGRVLCPTDDVLRLFFALSDELFRCASVPGDGTLRNGDTMLHVYLTGEKKTAVGHFVSRDAAALMKRLYPECRDFLDLLPLDSEVTAEKTEPKIIDNADVSVTKNHTFSLRFDTPDGCASFVAEGDFSDNEQSDDAPVYFCGAWDKIEALTESVTDGRYTRTLRRVHDTAFDIEPVADKLKALTPETGGKYEFVFKDRSNNTDLTVRQSKISQSIVDHISHYSPLSLTFPAEDVTDR